jgi:hypothetical protein
VNIDKVFLLSFTTNAFEKTSDLPIDLNIMSLGKDKSFSKIINVGKLNWLKDNEKIRGITLEEMLKNGLMPSSAIKFLNLFCEKFEINYFFTPNYKDDIKLFENIERESIITPSFKLKDFNHGINIYQKKLWEHLYNDDLKNNLIINLSAKERNLILKRNFNKLIKIHEINKK